MSNLKKSKKSKTHFEQVPLEIVKKIAEEEIPENEANGKVVNVEAPAKKLSRLTGSRINRR